MGSEGDIGWILCAVHAGSTDLSAPHRTPQRKHLAGPFFTEGSYTKNSRAEVVCTRALASPSPRFGDECPALELALTKTSLPCVSCQIEDLLSRLACTAALPGDPGEQPAAN